MRWLAIAGSLGIAAAAAAWVVAGMLIARIAATGLPAMPDRSVLPAAVADDVAAADANARARVTAATAGDLGIAYHGGLRPDEALQAYAVAQSIDARDWRWPYSRGLILEERGDSPAAFDAYAQAVSLAPANGLARLHVGDLQFKAGKLDEAEAAYVAARDASPAPAAAIGLPARVGIPVSAYASLGLARIEIDRGRADRAREALTRIVGAHPSFGSARALLRTLHPTAGVEAGRPAAGRGLAYVPPIDPVVDAVVARSHHIDLLLKHAALAARAGDQAWREWLARRALAVSPRDLGVLLEMSATLQAQGRHADALVYLQQCIEVAPDDHHPLVEQGKVLSELGRLDEAEKVLRRAVRVRDAAAEYNLGHVLDARDRWDEARVHYERSLAIDPFHARALNNLGIGLAQRGRLQEAIDLYTRAIDAAPDSADAYANLGAALLARGRFDDAIAVLDTAIELDPKAANAHNNRGIALAQTGRFDLARAAFETALRLDPKHADARRNLDALGARGARP